MGIEEQIPQMASSNNAEYTVKCIDAYSLEETIHNATRNFFDEGNAWLGDNFETDPYLYFKVERYAMDGNGFHVGYEEFVGRIRLYHKRDLGIHGIPYALSPYVVVPSTMDVHAIKPAEEPTTHTKAEALDYLKEYREFSNSMLVDNSMSDDEIMQEAYDRGLGEGDYYPPDEDFAYQELENYLMNILIRPMVQAEFHPASSEEENSRWTLGRYYFEMGTLDTGKE